MRSFEKEIDDLLGEESSKLNIECYIKFASFVFNNYQNYTTKFDIFINFASFLLEIKKDYENINGPLIIQIVEEKKDSKMMEIDSDISIKTEVNHNSNKIRKIYVIIVFGLVGCGKSSVFRILDEFSKQEFKKLNVFSASSDQYRSLLVQKYLKENPKSQFNEAFDKTGNKIGQRFMTHVESIIDKSFDDTKINFLYFDKNINPDTLSNTIQYLIILKSGM